MSTHDRGAFGVMMSLLERDGFTDLKFDCDLQASHESDRWKVSVLQDGGDWRSGEARGRTGEEALRRLLENLGTNGIPG